jgi:hypothetical protein
VPAVAPEGFPVVVSVDACTDPIYPIGVQLDLKLAILTPWNHSNALISR